MYEDQEKCNIATTSVLGGISRDTTVSKNIDRQIEDLTKQIERLQKLKVSLSEPGGLLNVSIQDLRFAMNY